MKLLGLDINSGDQNHISLSNGHFFNQENEYKQLIDHLMQQKVDGVVIGINGYGSRKIVPILKKVIQRINIVVHLIEEKSTSVICSSCGFRKIKKGSLSNIIDVKKLFIETLMRRSTYLKGLRKEIGDLMMIQS